MRIYALLEQPTRTLRWWALNIQQALLDTADIETSLKNGNSSALYSNVINLYHKDKILASLNQQHDDGDINFICVIGSSKVHLDGSFSLKIDDKQLMGVIVNMAICYLYPRRPT